VSTGDTLGAVDQAVDRAVTYRGFIREVAGRIDNAVTGRGRRLYGSRLAEAWRRSGGVLPLVPAELHRLFPELWPSERAARKDIPAAGTAEIAPVEADVGNAPVRFAPSSGAPFHP
jgi:hypothetical protein